MIIPTSGVVGGTGMSCSEEDTIHAFNDEYSIDIRQTMGVMNDLLSPNAVLLHTISSSFKRVSWHSH